MCSRRHRRPRLPLSPHQPCLCHPHLSSTGAGFHHGLRTRSLHRSFSAHADLLGDSRADERIPDTIDAVPSSLPRHQNGPCVPQARRLGILGRLEGPLRYQSLDWEGWDSCVSSNNQQEAVPSRGLVTATLRSSVRQKPP